MRYQQCRPENQARLAVDRIERKLVDAGLVTADPERTTWDDLFERWKRERQPKQNSVDETARAIAMFKKLVEYTSADARKYKDAVVALTSKGEPLAHASKMKWFGSMKALFRLADANDLLTVNPFGKIAGHEGADAGSGYGYGHVPIRTLKAEIEKVSFDLKIPKWTLK